MESQDRHSELENGTRNIPEAYRTADRAAGGAKKAAEGAKKAAGGVKAAAGGTVELAKNIRQKGLKKAAGNAAKNAGAGAARMALKVFAKLLSLLFLPVILLVVIFVLIAANTPSLILASLGEGAQKSVRVVEEIADTVQSGLNGNAADAMMNAYTVIKDWYYESYGDNVVTDQKTGEKITQEELERLTEAGDYDGVLAFYTEITQHYLDLAYEEAVADITKEADRHPSGKNTTYDLARTLETVGDNPFTGVDYANVLGCYSVTDSYDTANLSVYKEKLHRARKKFLDYTLTPQSYSYQVTTYDSDGNPDGSETHTVLWDEVTLIPYSPTQIFDIFDVDPDGIYEKSKSDNDTLRDSGGNDESEITCEQAYNEYYTTLRNKLDELGFGAGSVPGGGGGNCLSGSYGTVYTESEIEKMLSGLPSGISKNRKQLVKTALCMAGRIPYCNTGERSYPHYGCSPRWGQPSGNPKHPFVGLDCSGFVQWVYRNAWCDSRGNSPDGTYLGLSTTAAITASGNSRLKSISRSELKPGDLGTLRMGGSSGGNWNHVGIYMGNNTWVHCSGGQGTVVVSANYNAFKCFFTPVSGAAEKDNFWKKETIPPFLDNGTGTLDDDKFMVVATTLHCEFGDDDGFRACAEAVYHYSKYSGKDMYSTVKIKNYLDAYTKLYVTHEWSPDRRRPTSGQLKILEDVMKGNLTHFPSRRYPYPVMYFNTEAVPMTGWRSKGVVAEKIRGGNGVNVLFFYCKGVTYKGYK